MLVFRVAMFSACYEGTSCTVFRKIVGGESGYVKWGNFGNSFVV